MFFAILRPSLVSVNLSWFPMRRENEKARVWSFKILLKIPTRIPRDLVKRASAARILNVRTFRSFLLPSSKDGVTLCFIFSGGRVESDAHRTRRECKRNPFTRYSRERSKAFSRGYRFFHTTISRGMYVHKRWATEILRDKRNVRRNREREGGEGKMRRVYFERFRLV